MHKACFSCVVLYVHMPAFDGWDGDMCGGRWRQVCHCQEPQRLQDQVQHLRNMWAVQVSKRRPWVRDRFPEGTHMSHTWQQARKYQLRRNLLTRAKLQALLRGRRRISLIPPTALIAREIPSIQMHRL